MNDIYLISIIGFAFLIGSWLFVYDIKHYKLPNIGVLALGLLAIAFNYLNDFRMISAQNMLIGALVGSIFLLIIRAIANKYYKQETMGFGDVKLLFSLGLWVGYPDILITLSLGAFLSALIGYGIISFTKKSKKETSQVMHKIPAGPGFIIGMMIVFAQKYISLFENFILTLTP